jgi:trehalose utilization protein
MTRDDAELAPDDPPTRALVVTGGHSYDETALADLLASLPGVAVERAAHPDVDHRLHPDRVDADVIVLYDMPGVRIARGEPAEPLTPPPEVVEGWEALLAEGVPVVALHHSLCSWPAWPRFPELLGGSFLYAPGTVAARDWPDSGYRHDVEQVLTVVAPQHPVCAGLPASFTLTDETYLCPVFEEAVTPLVRTDAPRRDVDHESTAHALLPRNAERTPWHHPPGSSLAAWTHQVDRSTVVYLQPGDGAGAFTNANYQRLLTNAIRWAAATTP